MNRRRILGLLATTAVVAGAGAGAFALTRKPVAALEPWTSAGTQDDPRLYAMSYAILAPNPHNRQPWVVELDGDDQMRVYCDLDRRLPDTDPFDRQIVIGFGCMLELLEMAAAETGHRAEITMFPDGAPAPRLDERPIAHVRFVETADVVRDPLVAALPARRTNREPYDTARPVARGAAAPLVAAARHAAAKVTVEADQVARLRGITWRAHLMEVETPRTFQESIDLMRIGRSEIEANPDGIAISGAFLETLNMFGVLTRETLADPASTAFATGIDMFRKVFDSSMGFVWLETGEGRAAEIDAGRAWVRVNLAATAQGLALQPVSQSLQEYPEMAALFDEVHGELGVARPRKVQMLGRIGYGPDVAPSPRWPMESHIRTDA